jgi:nicotinate-nucleotide pyrophosphorylase
LKETDESLVVDIEFTDTPLVETRRTLPGAKKRLRNAVEVGVAARRWY